MLKTLDPLLDAPLLHALAAMGHGDEIVLVDANFPAAAVAETTTLGEPLRVTGADVVLVARAILTLLPLDTFVDDPAISMQMVGDPGTVPPVVTLLQDEVDRAHGSHLKIRAIERFAFYDRCRDAFAIVATSERRLYGNIILKKGVVLPEA